MNGIVTVSNFQFDTLTSIRCKMVERLSKMPELSPRILCVLYAYMVNRNGNQQLYLQYL